MRCPFDCLSRALRGDPDRRMRLLVGTRPKVHVLESIMFAIEGEGPGFGPCSKNEVMRLMKSCMRLCGVRTGGVIFHSNSAHETSDQAAGGNIIDDGELF